MYYYLAVMQKSQEVHQQTTHPPSGHEHPLPQVVISTCSSQQSSTTATKPVNHSTESTTTRGTVCTDILYVHICYTIAILQSGTPLLKDWI